MPNPKRRHSKARRATSTCPNCGEVKMPHRACPSCGQYRGNQVIEGKENL
jgi:large subunit ribosomal protein L32